MYQERVQLEKLQEKLVYSIEDLSESINELHGEISRFSDRIDIFGWTGEISGDNDEARKGIKEAYLEIGELEAQRRAAWQQERAYSNKVEKIRDKEWELKQAYWKRVGFLRKRYKAQRQRIAENRRELLKKRLGTLYGTLPPAQATFPVKMWKMVKKGETTILQPTIVELTERELRDLYTPRETNIYVY